MPLQCLLHKIVALSICLSPSCRQHRLLCQKCVLEDSTHIECMPYIVTLSNQKALIKRLQQRITQCPQLAVRTLQQSKEIELQAQQKVNSLQLRCKELFEQLRSRIRREVEEPLAQNKLKRRAQILSALKSIQESNSSIDSLLGQILAFKSPLQSNEVSQTRQFYSTLRNAYERLLEVQESSQQFRMVIRKGNAGSQNCIQSAQSKKLTFSTAESHTKQDQGPTYKKFRSLDFSKIKITKQGFRVLSTLHQLQRLSLENCRITDEQCRYLQQLCELVVLDLSFNFINLGVGMICKQKIRQLSLHSNRVTDQALVFMKQMNRLQRLDLFGNRLTREGIESLKVLRRLKQVNFFGNEETDSLESRKEKRGEKCLIF